MNWDIVMTHAYTEYVHILTWEHILSPYIWIPIWFSSLSLWLYRWNLRCYCLFHRALRTILSELFRPNLSAELHRIFAGFHFYDNICLILFLLQFLFYPVIKRYSLTLCIHFGSPFSSVWVPPKYFGICDGSTCSSIFGNHFFDSCLKIKIFPNVYSSKNRLTILKTIAKTLGTVNLKTVL